MVFDNASDNGNPWEELNDDLGLEIEQTQKELQEISMMLEQSQVEVNKLAQRNASISASLQQVHGSFDTLPREDIRTTYDTALDAQQRLFIMRGQLEKLQSDKAQLERYLKLLERVLGVMDGGNQQGDVRPRDAFRTVEVIIQAQESERQRLSRQMHDGPAQALSNFILQTEIAMRLFDIDQEKAREELSTLKDSATTTFQKVRDFVFELRPMMLDDLGLVPTLKRYVEAFKEQSAADVRFNVTGVERRLESYIEVMIFRAIQELMDNAFRQSQANQISTQMDITDAAIKISVEDNGKGFDADTVLEGSSMGLKMIKERVEMLGGFMEIDSVIGQGSRIVFQIPAGVTSQAVFA